MNVDFMTHPTPGTFLGIITSLEFLGWITKSPFQLTNKCFVNWSPKWILQILQKGFKIITNKRSLAGTMNILFTSQITLMNSLLVCSLKNAKYPKSTHVHCLKLPLQLIMKKGIWNIKRVVIDHWCLYRKQRRWGLVRHFVK